MKTPLQLTQEQIDTFERDGYLLVRGFADDATVQSILRAAREEIETRTPPIETEEEYQGTQSDRPTLRRLRQVYDRRDEFRAWMSDEAIRPALKTLLGDTPVLTLAHHNSIMTKMDTGSTETCWHQDRRYWSFENDDLLSVWLCLVEETMENGVLEFIPGTHAMTFSPEQFDEKICFRCDLEQNKALIEKRVHTDLHPGDVIFFHCRTLHHAYENKTDEPKISFVYTVKAQSNKPVPGTRSSRHPEVVLD